MMASELIDPAVLEIARRKIALDIQKQVQEIARHEIQARSEAAARGVLASSRTVLVIDKIYAEAVTARIGFIWQHTLRSIQASGVVFHEGLDIQIKDFVLSCMSSDDCVSEWAPDKEAARLGLINMSFYDKDTVIKAKQAALEHIYTEIDLFLLTLMKMPTSKNHQNVFHINDSTIGAVQTGDNSAATVNQILGNKQYAEIAKALQDLKAEVLAAPTLHQDRKEEVVDLINDSEQEIKKEKPNRAKLAVFLTGLGSMMQKTVDFAEKVPASLSALKGAANAIGLEIGSD